MKYIGDGDDNYKESDGRTLKIFYLITEMNRKFKFIYEIIQARRFL